IHHIPPIRAYHLEVRQFCGLSETGLRMHISGWTQPFHRSNSECHGIYVFSESKQKLRQVAQDADYPTGKRLCIKKKRKWSTFRDRERIKYQHFESEPAGRTLSARR